MKRESETKTKPDSAKPARSPVDYTALGTKGQDARTTVRGTAYQTLTADGVQRDGMEMPRFASESDAHEAFDAAFVKWLSGRESAHVVWRGYPECAAEGGDFTVTARLCFEAPASTITESVLRSASGDAA